MRNPCGRGESAGGLRREKAEDPRKGEGDPGEGRTEPPPRTGERTARLPRPAGVCARPRLRVATLPPPSLSLLLLLPRRQKQQRGRRGK